MREKHIEINRIPCEAHYWPAEKLVHGWEAMVVKTYSHVLPGWFKIGATGGTLSPLQKSSAKWAGHLAGPGLVNMIRELLSRTQQEATGSWSAIQNQVLYTGISFQNNNNIIQLSSHEFIYYH